LGRARTTIEAGLAIAQAIDYEAGIANALNHLGLVATLRGDDATAAVHFAESLALHQHLGDRYAESILLNNLGDNARRRGDLHGSIQYAEASLRVVRELGSQDGVAAELVNLAEAHLELGEHARAATLTNEAVRILTEIGNLDYLAPAYFVLGDALLRAGDADAALAAHQQALQVNERLGERTELAHGLDRIAALAGDWGDWTTAARLLGAAAVLRVATSATVTATDRARHDQTATAAEASLGAEVFAIHFAAGQALTATAAVAEAVALSGGDRARRPEMASPGDDQPTTLRSVQVTEQG
jgi:tetratricopeptide (TPR) repeat protein